MSALVVVAIALAAAVASRTAGRLSGAALAALGLGACIVAAGIVSPLATVELGGTTFALGAHGASIVAMAAVSLLLVLAAAGAVGSIGLGVPAALLVALAALTAGLAVLAGSLLATPSGSTAQFQAAGVSAPAVAVAIVAAAAIVLAPGAASGTDAASELGAVRAASRALRLLAVACGLGLLGAAWLLGPGGPVAPDSAGAAMALALVVGAVALFAGALPFHAVVARTLVSGPVALVAARAVWLPTAFALAAITWEQRVLTPAVPFGGVGEGPLLAETRSLVAVMALATLLAGALVATLHDDLRHVLAYALVGDAGLMLLAFAASDPSGAAAAASWLPANAVARTALTAWVLALTGRWGAAQIDELAGWLRRAPLLGLTLAGVALATFGLPGWGIFALRASLVGAGAGPFGPLMMVAAAWLGLLPYLRLAWVGLRSPSETVRGVRPAGARQELQPEPRRDPRQRPAERPKRAPSAARPALAEIVARWSAMRRSTDVLRAAWAANGAAIAAGFALLAALLAVAVSWAAGGALTAVD